MFPVRVSKGEAPTLHTSGWCNVYVFGHAFDAQVLPHLGGRSSVPLFAADNNTMVPSAGNTAVCNGKRDERQVVGLPQGIGELEKTKNFE